MHLGDKRSVLLASSPIHLTRTRVGVVPILGMTKLRFREVKRSPKAKSYLMTQRRVQLGTL